MARKQKGVTRKELLAIIGQAAREMWVVLDLHEQGISGPSAEIGQLANLQTLNLYGNQLTSLPKSIGQLANLQKLDLSDNQLASLPKSIGQLANLQTLNLHSNQLMSLPESISQLASLKTLNLRSNQLMSLPESIGQLASLQTLNLSDNQLVSLPESIGQLASLKTLNLYGNQLTSLPESIGQLASLQTLNLYSYQLTSLPESIGQLASLQTLNLYCYQLTSLPESIDQLVNLQTLGLCYNRLVSLPGWISQLANLQILDLNGNELVSLPESIGQLANLQTLDLSATELVSLPESIGQLVNLQILDLNDSELVSLPESIGQLANLQTLDLDHNRLMSIPLSLARLKKLKELKLDYNPLDPALQSAYKAGLSELMAYLRSLEEAEPLYEAKLVLVGEGGVGKTTLLKALMGREGEEPREGEPTTHGVQIDIHALRLPHPEKDGVDIQLNAWDFGGQEVYRVTHQFFFSRRSLYLLVWEPRAGVQQCQVEDWLKLIRLRVGDDARVLIVSTHCKTGERIARIDKPIFERDFGSMIVGFHEVDSLVDDDATGKKVGIAELKRIIAQEAAGLEQMGMGLNRNWKEARDELLTRPEARVTYEEFAQVCASHSLEAIDAETLAHLMHDLGYIVYYADDERLKDDVVLQPEWLTKAISFVLEDRTTQEMDGILPDDRLDEVWLDHHFENEPRYEPFIYPFFLRLMEKYDVSYRLPDGTGSLVAQHVPQVRPDLPWLPEQVVPDDNRRIAMICTMDEEPPGLVPWMIVRTHDYAAERECDDKHVHRLHWQKGMFLCHPPHGEAMLEQRGREFHIYAQAVWPEYFMNVLQHTLDKLITDNWPGLKGRYGFTVPCPSRIDGKPCPGRFKIDALRQFLAKGARMFPCQECLNLHSITELLLGFEERTVEAQLRDIQDRLDGLDSRIANYVMALMHAIADEAKHGPRLFTIEPVDEGGKLAPRRLVSTRLRLQLWCEAEGCQHKVFDEGVGFYEFNAPHEWIQKAVPYANFVIGLLKTALPVAAPAVDVFFGKDTIKNWDYSAHLDLAKAFIGKLPEEIKVRERPGLRPDILSEAERSGLLAMHALLRELDPNQEKLGLTRVATYTGDYRWLCHKHYRAWEPRIPDKIE
jgi:internalin A